MTERREQDSLERILHDVENTENARKYPYVYVDQLWRLIQICYLREQGYTHVLPDVSPEKIEQVREVALKGMNTVGYVFELLEGEDHIGTLYASPQAARVFGESVIINNFIHLKVVPKPEIRDPLNFQMSYVDGIIVFGTDANKGKIKANVEIKRGPRIPEELTVEEAKKLMTYKDREPQTKSQ
jgi:KaiC/GvpD/RAD55 family RecA-like ATPase